VIQVRFELRECHAEALDRMLRRLTFEAICSCEGTNQERYDLVVAIERLRIALEGSEPANTAERSTSLSASADRASWAP
jgi:hypothetical protein